MSAYRTIVVGTDGSERSMRAVDRAATVAGATDATLLVVCAYCPTIAWATPEAAAALASQEYLDTMSQAAERTLHDATDRAHARGAGTVKTHAVRGNAGIALTDVVTDTDADLLVVGDRGLGTLTGRLLGSVPAHVSPHADCDVMVVRTADRGIQASVGL